MGREKTDGTAQEGCDVGRKDGLPGGSEGGAKGIERRGASCTKGSQMEEAAGERRHGAKGRVAAAAMPNRFAANTILLHGKSGEKNVERIIQVNLL